MQKFTIILLICQWLYLYPAMAQTGVYTQQGNLTMNASVITEIQLKNLSGPGTGHDQIRVAGNLSLGGTLTIVRDGYFPDLSHSFVICTYTGTLTGAFSSISWPAGMTSGWAIDYGLIVPGQLTIYGIQSGLPVELMSFEGKAFDDGNKLFWHTASEVNADYFGIEWSIDGIKWTEIDQIKATGNHATSHQYTYNHAEKKRVTNYYRLKQMDYDGNFTYSSVVNINRNFISNSITIFPNPTSGTMYFNENINHLSVFDNMGRQLIQSSNNITSIDISHLPGGTYYVSINRSKEYTKIVLLNK